MKRAELSRAMKEKLWNLFDQGQTFEGVTNVVIDMERVPDEAVAKQRGLWKEYRTRNPKR